MPTILCSRWRGVSPRQRWHRGTHIVLMCVLLFLSGCGGIGPRIAPELETLEALGHDWQRHYDFAVQQLGNEDPYVRRNSVFTRAAFSSAARLSRDFAPAYAGLGLAEINLGNLSEAEVAFLNAALIEDRSLYWALGALAALRNGDEYLARSFYDAQRMARIQDEDPVSSFIRAVYEEGDQTFGGELQLVATKRPDTNVSEGLECDDHSDDALCSNLNVVAHVYFVRRESTDITVRGTNFFNDLVVKLGAESEFEWRRGEPREVLHTVSLSIPDIEYAVRLTPHNTRSSVYLSAAPSVITAIGRVSEVREGSDLTILYNSEGYADEFTAETGLTLRIEPVVATAEYVRMKLDFEYSSVGSLQPSEQAQVLNVSTNNYSVTGHFPYGKPVVLGTISGSSQSYNGAGQVGARRIPFVGGAFGQSRDENTDSETLVLGVLSEPSVFRGSREQKVLKAMRDMGVETPVHDEIRRRKIIYQAPDVSTFLPDFLRQYTSR